MGGRRDGGIGRRGDKGTARLRQNCRLVGGEKGTDWIGRVFGHPIILSPRHLVSLSCLAVALSHRLAVSPSPDLVVPQSRCLSLSLPSAPAGDGKLGMEEAGAEVAGDRAIELGVDRQ